MEQLSITKSQFLALLDEFPQKIELKDRKYKLKTYKSCFVGRDAVTWLVENNYAVNREEAVVVGNLLRTRGVFCHVVKEHPFEDKHLFYKLQVRSSLNTILVLTLLRTNSGQSSARRLFSSIQYRGRCTAVSRINFILDEILLKINKGLNLFFSQFYSQRSGRIDSRASKRNHHVFRFSFTQ